MREAKRVDYTRPRYKEEEKTEKEEVKEEEPAATFKPATKSNDNPAKLYKTDIILASGYDRD